MGQVEGLLRHFESALVASRFLDPANPGQTMTRVRRLFTRVALDETEVQILRGILTALAPAGTPAAIVKRLNAEVERALQVKEVRDRLVQIG